MGIGDLDILYYILFNKIYHNKKINFAIYKKRK